MYKHLVSHNYMIYCIELVVEAIEMLIHKWHLAAIIMFHYACFVNTAYSIYQDWKNFLQIFCRPVARIFRRAVIWQCL